MCAVKKLIGVCLIGLAVASPIVVPSAAAPHETEDGITEWPHFNPVDVTPTIKLEPTNQPRATPSFSNKCGLPPLKPCRGLEDEISRILEAHPLPTKEPDDPKKPLVRPGRQIPHIIPPKVPHPPAGDYGEEKEDGSDPKAPGLKRDLAGAEAEPWVTGLHDSEDDDGPVPAGPVTTPTGIIVTRVTVTTTIPTTTTVSSKKSAAPVPTGPVTVSAQVTVTTSTITVISTVPTTVSKLVPVIPVTTSTIVPVVTSTGVNLTMLTAVWTTDSTKVETTISKWVPTTFSTWFLTTSSTVSTLVGDPSERPGTYTNPDPKATSLEVRRPSDKNSDAPGSVEEPTAKFPGTYTRSSKATVSTTVPSTVTKPAHQVQETAYVLVPPNLSSAETPEPTRPAAKDKDHDQHVDGDDDSVRLSPLLPLQARDPEPKYIPTRPLEVPTELFGPMKTVVPYLTVTATVTDLAST
ncbi:hypothetical protein DL770_005317 [Monosporascus sp. CRB-9-2]|nr:hypothetical protein DL770_005317 [Monosporascus sp. CRB-9-2]